MTIAWTPPAIDAATRKAARLTFEAQDLAATADTPARRRIADLIAEDCGRILDELPAGFPEAIEPGANPGGYVAIYVDISGRQLRIPLPADPARASAAIGAVWTPAVIAGVAWRLVIFDGDEGLCPLEVWTRDQFANLVPT
jgi:hypothetical protein